MLTNGAGRKKKTTGLSHIQQKFPQLSNKGKLICTMDGVCVYRLGFILATVLIYTTLIKVCINQLMEKVR